MKYFNIDDRYGEINSPVTIEELRELNPDGEFRYGFNRLTIEEYLDSVFRTPDWGGMDPKEYIQYGFGQWVTVASRNPYE